MKPDPREAEALFDRALEFEAGERAAFLAGACGNDATLHRRVKDLLLASEKHSGFLPGEQTTDSSASAAHAFSLTDRPGSQIGRYKLLEKVGEGGCGAVYVAEQTEPVRRRVALKVIKLGMDTRQVIARFEAERQALAMMDHPNIAKVLDAGTTEGRLPSHSLEGGDKVAAQLPAGRPYFVMELVRGVKITEFCDEARLSTKERLDLFIKVCQAIQHAHQKGIIHRDIKPSNILVTLHDGVPVPKVIDFGIAKATQGRRLTDGTVYTQLHQFIGTPAYMSPEQAEMSGLDIDTRSDIYSLGVVLYELLAGSTPFDGKELLISGLDAMRRTIREKEPPRPSTKLTSELSALDITSRKSTTGLAIPTVEEVTADSRRKMRLKEQIARVKGDLDWIVMKCLEKDRARRYDTANAIAADLQRHLNNELVTARPPSTSYRLEKAFRRNKLVFGAGAFVAAALLTGLVALGFAWTAQRKQAAADLAATEAEGQATATARFTAALLDEVVPNLLKREDRAGIRTLFDSADKMIALQLTNFPTAEFMVRHRLAFLLAQLGEFAKSSEQFARVQALFPRLPEKVISLPDRDRLRLNAATLKLASPNGESQGILQLRSLREEFLKRDPRPLQLIAGTQIWEGIAGMWGGRFDEVEPLYLSAIENFSSRTGADLERPTPVWLNTASAYARALVLQGKYVQAEPYARQSAGLIRRIDGEWATETHSSVVWSLCGQNRFDAADEFLRSRLDSADQWDRDQLAALEALRGSVQVAAGRWQAAVPRLRDLAVSKDVASEFWKLGVLATVAAGDSNGFVSLLQIGSERYASGAHTKSAHDLLLAIGAGWPSPEILALIPGVLKRLEDAPLGVWTIGLPLNLARLEYRRGHYAQALTHLEKWHSTPVDSLVERTTHQMEARNPHPYYLRAIILARLERPMEEVTAAYRAGLERDQPGRPGEMRHVNYLMMMEQFFLNRIFQTEAMEVMRSKGIPVSRLESSAARNAELF